MLRIQVSFGILEHSNVILLSYAGKTLVNEALASPQGIEKCK